MPAVLLSPRYQVPKSPTRNYGRRFGRGSTPPFLVEDRECALQPSCRAQPAWAVPSYAMPSSCDLQKPPLNAKPLEFLIRSTYYFHRAAVVLFAVETPTRIECNEPIHGITCIGWVSQQQIPAKTSGRHTPFHQVAMPDAETPQQYTRSGSTGNRLKAIATAAAKTSRWSTIFWRS